jgi:hypothetical protein
MTVSTQSIEQVLDREADQIAARIGADPAQTRQAISVALPTLLAGLQREAVPGSGLQQAIQQDHDGSILDDIAGYLGGTANLGPRTTNGAGILGHVFGEQQPQIHQALSTKSGLDIGAIAQLLPLLAPIVMGMLGRQARNEAPGAGSGGLGDLGGILGGLLGGSTAAGAGGAGGLGDLLGGLLGGTQNR